MKVLVVNKFGYLRGGLERVVFDEMAALRALGHDVELFATAHPENLPHRFADEFPPYHEIGVGATSSSGAVRDMFSNRDAARAIERVIERFRPDVVHFHGIHRHLSPSVLFAARQAGVPTVFTAHDYFAICPQNTLLLGGERPCVPRRCGNRLFLGAVANRCVQHSLPRSVLAAAELGFQRCRRAYERGIDAIIAPSEFMRVSLIEGGFASMRITVVPNAAPVSEYPVASAAERRAFLFAGRLSPEKGALVAARAAELAGVELRLAGSGSEAERVRSASAHVQLLGHLGRAALEREMATAIAVLVPSMVPENASIAVLEAMAASTPVIGSAIGGIPEQIEDGVSGLLVEPGDAESLAAALRELVGDPERAARMGAAARERVAARFSEAAHIEGVLGVYRSVGALA